MATTEPSDHEKIRRDLVRTVIKEPLYSEINKARSSADAVPDLAIIIEINDGYYRGKSEAAKWLNDLVKEAAQAMRAPVTSVVTSIGSEQNPYYKIRLPPDVIVELVEA